MRKVIGGNILMKIYSTSTIKQEGPGEIAIELLDVPHFVFIFDIDGWIGRIPVASFSQAIVSLAFELNGAFTCVLTSKFNFHYWSHLYFLL